VLLLIACLSVLMHLPHLLGQVRSNVDFDVHIHWATETTQMMAAGDPRPRWMTAGKGGLGEPVLLYYAPPYCMASGLLRPLTGTTLMAMTFVNLFATLCCGWLS